MESNDETMDLSRAADFLKMSVSALRYKAKQGVINGAKPAKKWVFLKQDLVAFIRSHYDEPVEIPLSDFQIHREVKLCHSINAEKRGGCQLYSTKWTASTLFCWNERKRPSTRIPR